MMLAAYLPPAAGSCLQGPHIDPRARGLASVTVVLKLPLFTSKSKAPQQRYHDARARGWRPSGSDASAEDSESALQSFSNLARNLGVRSMLRSAVLITGSASIFKLERVGRAAVSLLKSDTRAVTPGASAFLITNEWQELEVLIALSSGTIMMQAQWLRPVRAVVFPSVRRE